LYKMVTVSQYFSPALRRTKKYGLPKELRSRDIDG
jgi:hypothetical protein